MMNSKCVEIVDYVKDRLIGKTVVAAPITTTTNAGRTEGVYVDQTFFCNLLVAVNGFQLDLITITRGRLYELDKKGERVQPEGSLDAVRVYRYHMTDRKSSGDAVGYARFVSSSNMQPDPMSGAIFLVRMWLEDDALVIQETQSGYADFVAPDGESKAGSFDVKSRYLIEDGRLVLHFEQATYDVDPETLQRTPTNDRFPVQVSREVEFPDVVTAEMVVD